MSKRDKEGYEIYISETLLGVAVLVECDQPFYICSFEPTTEFEQYRQRFDEYTDAVEHPRPGDDIGKLWEEDIGELHLRLVPFGGAYEGQVFVTKIVNGSEIWLSPI